MKAILFSLRLIEYALFYDEIYILQNNVITLTKIDAMAIIIAIKANSLEHFASYNVADIE